MRMNAQLKIILSMFIFGTIGIFRRYIPLPSSLVAMVRGVVGALFLLAVMALRRQKLDFSAIRRALPKLLLSSACLGFNWILLFEAYNYTTVATATLCYYFAPMFIILVSPLLLKERITARKLICVLVALVGMVFVSGVLDAGINSIAELRGVLLGLAAAVLYASVVLINKKTVGIPANDRTVMQLGISAIILLPYVLLTENLGQIELGAGGGMLLVLGMLLLVGILHTGVAYYLYFGAITTVKAQTAAILSYIDPVIAILLSALLLGEPMTLLGGIGAVLVLGSAIVSELPEKQKWNEKVYRRRSL